MHPILEFLSLFLSFSITMIALFYYPVPKMKFLSRGIENNAHITTQLKMFTLGVIIMITLAILFINTPRVIKPLQVPVVEKSYSNNLINKAFVQHTDKPAFIDKYRDDINTAINTKLNQYRIPECELTKPGEYETSLLCGGYSLNHISAVDKNTGETYTLTPQLNYDRSASTVRLVIKEEKGYKNNA